MQPQVIKVQLVPRPDYVETFIPQFPGIQDCASTNKAPAVCVNTVETLPKDTDLPARNCNHHIRIKHGGCEQRHHHQDGYARQVTSEETPQSRLLPRERLSIKGLWILYHQPFSIERGSTIRPSSMRILRAGKSSSSR